MKKFGFGPLFVIMVLLCAVLALTCAASKISHDAAPTNKISNGTVQKQQQIKGVVIHRRARPNNSSAQSLNKHPFFIFASIASLLLLTIVVHY